MRKGLDYKWTSENILGWWIYFITCLWWVLCDSMFIKTHRTVTSKCVNIIICKLLVSFKEREKCNFSASVKHLSNGNDAAVSVDNAMMGSFCKWEHFWVLCNAWSAKQLPNIITKFFWFAFVFSYPAKLFCYLWKFIHWFFQLFEINYQ